MDVSELMVCAVHILLSNQANRKYGAPTEHKDLLPFVMCIEPCN